MDRISSILLFLKILILSILILGQYGCSKYGSQPVAIINSYPNEGNRYTIFYFDAGESYDPDNLKYGLTFRWDFYGDGSWEYDYSDKSNVSFKFENTGDNIVILEVKDPQGNTSQSTAIISISDKNFAPIADSKVVPPIGSLSTKFVFDASRSYDMEESNQFLRYRWDISANSIWDTEYSDDPLFLYVFTSPGFYSVVVEVIDSEGSISSDTSHIEVKNTYNDYSFIEDSRDGEIYSTVKIGEQWVMAENLRYGTFIDKSVTPRNNDICEVFAYNNNPGNIEKYGGLYIFAEISNYNYFRYVRDMCPEGWHIPTDQEWTMMEQSLGFYEEGYYLLNNWQRAEGFGDLLKKDGGSGFEAGMFGFMDDSRISSSYGKETYFWTNSKAYLNKVLFIRGLSSQSSGIIRKRAITTFAYSVRCFKDQ